MDNYTLGILKNEIESDSSFYWIKACEKYRIKYEIIELTHQNWIEKVQNGNINYFLACPPGLTSSYKMLYDERIYILAKVLKKKLFPSYEETIIHENKRVLAYWLEANQLPHPKTYIFYFKNEAVEFLKKTQYPIVAKTNIGASGNGVQILKNLDNSLKYCDMAFSKTGIRQKIGPNLKIGNYGTRLKRFIQDKNHRQERLSKYRQIYHDPQRNFVIFQEFIPHDFEWRAVRIGESYFAHKKVKMGDKCSGSKGIDYVTPPVDLLNFIKELCERFNFNSMAVDLFEDGKGGYLINELQTIFGHVQQYILSIDGKPGRYIFQNQNWKFEEGFFNTNLSYDLRLNHVLKILNQYN